MTNLPAKRTANSARRALAILGDRWTLLILRDAFLGVQQFGVWQTRLGIAPTVLTRRLKELVKARILHRQQTGALQTQVEYHLTEKGFDIYGIAVMVLKWEQRWYDAPRDAEIVLHHARCNQPANPQFTCGSCSMPVTARDVQPKLGPGARAEAISGKRMRRTLVEKSPGSSTSRFLEHAVTILGDRWSWEVVGAAFQGRRRFDDIQTDTGIATNILADRLRRLCADGIFVRRTYQQSPARHEYVLTEKGRDFYPATVMLLWWGDRWMAGKRGPPLLLVHTICGGPLKPQVTCGACGGVLDAHDVTYSFADGTSYKSSAADRLARRGRATK